MHHKLIASRLMHQTKKTSESASSLPKNQELDQEASHRQNGTGDSQEKPTSPDDRNPSAGEHVPLSLGLSRIIDMELDSSDTTTASSTSDKASRADPQIVQPDEITSKHALTAEDTSIRHSTAAATTSNLLTNALLNSSGAGVSSEDLAAALSGNPLASFLQQQQQQQMGQIRQLQATMQARYLLQQQAGIGATGVANPYLEVLARQQLAAGLMVGASASVALQGRGGPLDGVLPMLAPGNLASVPTNSPVKPVEITTEGAAKSKRAQTREPEGRDAAPSKLAKISRPAKKTETKLEPSSSDGEENGPAGHRFRPYQYEQWTEKFQELRDFCKEKGHCQVPHTYSENPPLARWVKRQRYQYKLMADNKQSTMTDERIQLLEDIGFIWDSHAAAWAEKLNELKDYARLRGDCNVPSTYPNNPQLATWVKCQRRQYKLLRDRKTSNMTMDRIVELESIGFVWEVRKTEPRNKA